MKKFAAFLFLQCLLNANISAQNFDWAKSWDARTIEGSHSISIDNVGNVVTIGGFYGTVDFDPGIDTFNLTAPTAGIGFFISKFNSQGVFIWAKSIDSLPWYGSFQVLCTNDNSIIVAGHFTTTVDFDPDTSAHFIQACADDYFVAKYDSNGKFIWVKSFCGSYSAISVGLQTDDNKNVFVAGNFIGKVDFNPGPGKANVISKGINDIFIVKLDSNGKFIWVKTFGGKKNDQINSMKIDRFGNIYTIGSFEDKVDFDPAIGIFIDSVMGGSDTFISKLDSGGNFIWAKSFKGIYDEWGFDLDVDSAGNVYSIGVFFDSVDFNPDTTNFSMKSAGFMDVFISKLDSSGNFVWAKSIGGGSNDWGLRIALDASEEIFISGHFYGTSDLNPGVGVYNAVSPINNLDIFIVKLEGSGDFIKAYTFGDLGSDVISGIAIDKKNVYAVGTFWGVVDFDPGAGVSLLTGSNTKGTIFLLKLSQTSTGIFQINQSQNFSIYPNPSNGNFTINVKNKNATNFEIYNVMGEKIFSTKLINPKTEIELKAKPGMYFYQIKNDNGIIENSKIVIQ